MKISTLKSFRRKMKFYIMYANKTNRKLILFSSLTRKHIPTRFPTNPDRKKNMIIIIIDFRRLPHPSRRRVSLHPSTRDSDAPKTSTSRCLQLFSVAGVAVCLAMRQRRLRFERFIRFPDVIVVYVVFFFGAAAAAAGWRMIGADGRRVRFSMFS